MDKIEVTMIRVKIGELEFEMTPADAKKLLKVLQELVGDKPADPIIPWPNTPPIKYPEPQPQMPWEPWSEPKTPWNPPWNEPYKIWCQSQQFDTNAATYKLQAGAFNQNATLIAKLKDNASS